MPSGAEHGLERSGDHRRGRGCGRAGGRNAGATAMTARSSLPATSPISALSAPTAVEEVPAWRDGRGSALAAWGGFLRPERHRAGDRRPDRRHRSAAEERAVYRRVGTRLRQADPRDRLTCAQASGARRGARRRSHPAHHRRCAAPVRGDGGRRANRHHRRWLYRPRSCGGHARGGQARHRDRGRGPAAQAGDEPDVSDFFRKLHTSHGAEIRLGERVVGLLGERQVSAVELDDGVRVAADLVLVAIGGRASDALAATAGLRCPGRHHRGCAWHGRPRHLRGWRLRALSLAPLWPLRPARERAERRRSGARGGAGDCRNAGSLRPRALVLVRPSTI